MRIAVLSAVLIMLCSVQALATTTESPDGVWWTGLNEGEQLVAVESEIDSFLSGYNQGWIASTTHFNPHIDGARNVSAALKLRPKFSRTFGFYRSSITDFYTTHGNGQTVDVAQVMNCLQDDYSTFTDKCFALAIKTANG
jgi:hypothetical protein